MAISTLYKLDKVVLPAGVEFSNIKSARWAAGISDMLEMPAGNVFPMFTANQVQKPQLEFQTSELGVLLGAIGVGGAAVGSSAAFFKLATQTGAVARASASHSKITLTSSCAYWTSIRLSHNAPAEANIVLVAGYDGANDPFIYAGGVALSGSLIAGSWFGVGPVKINGTLVPGIKDVTIDSGIKLIREGGESEEFDTFVGIEECKPTITIRTLTAVNWATLGLRGLALDGAAGVLVYGRKFAQNGSRVANGTAQHVSFIGLNGVARPVDTSGDGSAPISDSIKCVLTTVSDSVAPLTVNGATAIS